MFIVLLIHKKGNGHGRMSTSRKDLVTPFSVYKKELLLYLPSLYSHYQGCWQHATVSASFYDC